MAKAKPTPKDGRLKTSLALGPATVALLKAVAEAESADTGYRITQSDIIRAAVLKLASERLPADQVDRILGTGTK